MPQLTANNVAGALASAVTNVATSIPLTSAAGFPVPTGGNYTLLTLIGINGSGQEGSWEIVRCTGVTGSTLTVVRAQEGTTALAWGTGTRCELRLTAGFAANLFAEPPALGSVTPGTGKFTTLETTGNILAGTALSSYAAAGRTLVHVDGTTDSLVVLTRSGTNNFYLQNNSLGVYLWSNASTPLVFGTANAERLRITDAGDVFIGRATNIGVSAKFVVESGGNGIHTNTPNNSSAIAFHVGGTQVGSCFVTTTTTTYNTSSDYRLKLNQAPLQNSGDFIDALKPKTWIWTDGSLGVGFIAHEFQEVSPSSVTGTKDEVDAEGKPKYQSMQASTAEVIANLVAELQSLRARITALEAA